jgi:hypothetical protein
MAQRLEALRTCRLAARSELTAGLVASVVSRASARRQQFVDFAHQVGPARLLARLLTNPFREPRSGLSRLGMQPHAQLGSLRFLMQRDKLRLERNEPGRVARELLA